MFRIRKVLPQMSLLIFLSYSSVGFKTIDNLQSLKRAPIFNSIKAEVDKTYSLAISQTGAADIFYTSDSAQLHKIETLGFSDTLIRASRIQSKRLSDFNSLDFQPKAKTEAKFNIYYRGFESGNQMTSFRIRKQQASLFALNEFKSDLSSVHSSLNKLFQVSEHVDPTFSVITGTNNLSINNLDNEIVFISTHGAPAYISLMNGGMSSSDIPFLINNKITLISACESAQGNSSFASISEQFVLRGAKSSVGFNKVINSSSAKTFSNEFFKQISSGQTVETASKKAASKLFLASDSAKDYVIFGNKNTTVNDTININALNSSSKNYVHLTDIGKLLGNEYEKQHLYDDTYRYIKTIDNIITDSYLDVKENNEGFYIEKNHISDYNKVNKINYYPHIISDSIMESGRKYTLFNNKTDYLYLTKNNTMIPFSVIFADYSFKEQKIQKVYCTNLFDGSDITYSEILLALEGR